MTKAPPERTPAGPKYCPNQRQCVGRAPAAYDAPCPIPAPTVRPCRHTAGVTIRYSVQAETRDECVAGLEHLVQLGLIPVMLPVQVMADRWMARAVPAPQQDSGQPDAPQT